MPLTSPRQVLPTLQKTIDELVRQFDQIPPERKPVLQQLTDFINQNIEKNTNSLLNFICTHNSRRSHISQIWAQAAAYFYGIDNVETFSGGTEATAFNPRAVAAMKNVGFAIDLKADGPNPTYEVRFSPNASVVTVFSKKYDHALNPKKDFAAVMTCAHADENCPVVIGATQRISLTYSDPKDFDGTPQESEMYAERVKEIGREILYAFSQVKKKCSSLHRESIRCYHCWRGSKWPGRCILSASYRSIFHHS